MGNSSNVVVSKQHHQSTSTQLLLHIHTHQHFTMYSKLVCGLALTVGAAHGAAHNLVRRDGAHGHHAAAAAPASGYEQPAADAGYAAPAVSYGYDEPPADTGYGAATGYGEEGGFDIATLLIPILILAGLSLLFPTITTVDVNSSGRKKRHTGEDVNPMTDVVERVNDIYSAVVQSEECMERIACEIGGLAADVGLTQSPAVKLAGGFVPSKYKLL